MRSSEETMLIPSSRRNLNQEYLEYCQADLPHPVGNSGPEKRWQVLSIGLGLILDEFRISARIELMRDTRPFIMRRR